MSVVTTGRRLDRFLSDLSALVEALPSPDVKAGMDADLASLIEFLQNFRTKLSSLPTDEGADQIASTIEAVKDFVRIAEADPVLCRVLGLSEQRTSERPAEDASRQVPPVGRPRKRRLTNCGSCRRTMSSMRWPIGQHTTCRLCGRSLPSSA